MGKAADIDAFETLRCGLVMRERRWNQSFCSSRYLLCLPQTRDDPEVKEVF